MYGRLDRFALRFVCCLAFILPVQVLAQACDTSQAQALVTSGSCSDAVSWVAQNRCGAPSGTMAQYRYSDRHWVRRESDQYLYLQCSRTDTNSGAVVNETWGACINLPLNCLTEEFGATQPPLFPHEVPAVDCSDAQPFTLAATVSSVGCSDGCRVSVAPDPVGHVVVNSLGQTVEYRSLVLTRTGEVCTDYSPGPDEHTLAGSGEDGWDLPPLVNQTWPALVPEARRVDPPPIRSGGCLGGVGVGFNCTNPHSPPPPPAVPVATWSTSQVGPSSPSPTVRSGVVYVPSGQSLPAPGSPGSPGSGTGPGEGSGGRGTASASCSSQPYCSDPLSVQCALLRQQWASMCHFPEVPSVSELGDSLGIGVSGPISDSVLQFDPGDSAAGFLAAQTCTPFDVSVLGRSFVIGMHCDLLPWLQPLVLISAALVAFRILSA